MTTDYEGFMRDIDPQDYVVLRDLVMRHADRKPLPLNHIGDMARTISINRLATLFDEERLYVGVKHDL